MVDLHHGKRLIMVDWDNKCSCWALEREAAIIGPPPWKAALE